MTARPRLRRPGSRARCAGSGRCPSATATTNATMPDDPPARALLVRLQRDQALRERQRQDEDGRRERQQEHVAVAEVPLARRRASGRPTGRSSVAATTSRSTHSATHDARPVGACRCGSRRACPRSRAPASFGSSAACTAWNSSSGTRATNRPVMKCERGPSGCASRAGCTPNTLAYDEQLREHGSERAARPSAPDSSEYGASGPGVRRPLLTAQRDRDGEQRRRGEREARRARPTSTPTANKRDAHDDADGALGAVHEAVRAEATVARQRAAGDERDVVADDRRRTAPTSRMARPSNSWSMMRLVRDRGDARDDGEREHAAEQRGPLHERAAALAAGPAGRDRAPDLLLERLEEARARTRTPSPRAR